MKHLCASITAVLCVAAFALGCGGKKEADNPQQGFYPQPDPNAPPPQQQPNYDPGPQPGGQPAAAGPVPNDPMIQQAMAAQIAMLAPNQAKGMKQEGEGAGANLQQGQSVELLFMLQPNKCYTAIGLGMPSIQDIGIVMVPVVPVLGGVGVLAQSQTQGTQVTMAPSPNCFTHLFPMPMQAKIVVTARAGAGPVGVQLYVK
ncbi:MAG: hypothetical protein FWD57_01865 [Polyangiaceae bacterium]|nr:hypothetical protein [Polyangiaceae bacterium]